MRKIIYLVVFLTCTSAFSQKDKKIVSKTVDKAAIAAHLKFLSSDALQGRDTPSQGLEVAAAYIQAQLELYGVKPFPEYPDYFQPVSMKKVVKPTGGFIQVDTSNFKIGEEFLLLSGGNLEWSGSYIFLDYATREELEAADVAGKIIVANAGDGQDQSPRSWFRMAGEKRAHAAEAGAVALIELYNSPQIPWQLLVRYLSGDQVALDKGEETEDFPSIWLNDANRASSAVFKAADELTLEMTGAEVELFEVNNVVGYVEGTDPKLKDEFVAYTAHYDHVGVGRPDSTGDGIYNGTRDNAVGTVTVIEAARTWPNTRQSAPLYLSCLRVKKKVFWGANGMWKTAR